jgi:hypothetical protein
VVEQACGQTVCPCAHEGGWCGDSLLNTVVTANMRAKGLTLNDKGTWITRVTMDHEEGYAIRWGAQLMSCRSCTATRGLSKWECHKWTV